MTDGEGFVYVNYGRKSRKGKGRMRNQSPPPFADSLQQTRDGLVSSGWWESYRVEIVPAIGQARRSVLGSGERLEDTNGHTDNNEVSPTSRWRCLCLGLGPPATSEIARAQLCVLIDLCAELGIAPGDTEVFDPAFEELDRAGLRGLGLQVPGTNKKGHYVIDVQTLVFMPHCGVKLYERFLRANWTDEGRGRIILVGNDLRAYVESPLHSAPHNPKGLPLLYFWSRASNQASVGSADPSIPVCQCLLTVNHARANRVSRISTPGRKLEARSPCVARLAPHLQSTPFPPSVKLPGAFNNTALQVLIRGNVSDKDAWALPPETEALGNSDEDGSDGEVR